MLTKNYLAGLKKDLIERLHAAQQQSRGQPHVDDDNTEELPGQGLEAAQMINPEQQQQIYGQQIIGQMQQFAPEGLAYVTGFDINQQQQYAGISIDPNLAYQQQQAFMIQQQQEALLVQQQQEQLAVRQQQELLAARQQQQEQLAARQQQEQLAARQLQEQEQQQLYLQQQQQQLEVARQQQIEYERQQQELLIQQQREQQEAAARQEALRRQQELEMIRQREEEARQREFEAQQQQALGEQRRQQEAEEAAALEREKAAFIQAAQEEEARRLEADLMRQQQELLAMEERNRANANQEAELARAQAEEDARRIEEQQKLAEEQNRLRDQELREKEAMRIESEKLRQEQLAKQEFDRQQQLLQQQEQEARRRQIQEQEEANRIRQEQELLERQRLAEEAEQLRQQQLEAAKADAEKEFEKQRQMAIAEEELRREIEAMNDVQETPAAESSDEEDDSEQPVKTGQDKENANKQRLTKTQKKNLKKKKSKQNKRANKSQVKTDLANGEASKTAEGDQANPVEVDGEDVKLDKVEIEYVPEEIEKDNKNFAQFSKVFDKFRTGDTSRIDDYVAKPMDDRRKMLERKKPVELELKDEDENLDGEPKLSKKKMRLMSRMSVADLKQKVTNAELVEMHDVTARDPVLLMFMKSTRNSVPVPRHWCYKRKYLQGKRGFEKPPFKLPEFIRRTGIQEMREAVQEKDDSKSLKTKMKEKMRPKMGKIDIDYQKLHDAFFKWQTKPYMTIHGDLYYEGKEFETRLKEKKPGELTSDLRTALGMPTGVNAHKIPPPWLIAMQRYGPPPSYPNLKIAGLNAPIPEGCSFGYHAGGWGKPPVDEYGRPLYGDVFGLSGAGVDLHAEEEVDRTRWGELEEESEEEESEEEEEEAAENKEGQEEGAAPEGRRENWSEAEPIAGMATPSGFSSLPPGIETPGMIELRKRRIEADMEEGDNHQLYQVLSERRNDKLGSQMMASTHTYDIHGAKTSRQREGMDVALDPDDLELDPAQRQAKLEASYHQSQGNPGLAKEDLSDMVAEHVQRVKRQKTAKGNEGGKAKQKEKFKF